MTAIYTADLLSGDDPMDTLSMPPTSQQNPHGTIGEALPSASIMSARPFSPSLASFTPTQTQGVRTPGPDALDNDLAFFLGGDANGNLFGAGGPGTATAGGLNLGGLGGGLGLGNGTATGFGATNGSVFSNAREWPTTEWGKRAQTMRREMSEGGIVSAPPTAIGDMFPSPISRPRNGTPGYIPQPIGAPPTPAPPPSSTAPSLPPGLGYQSALETPSSAHKAPSAPPLPATGVNTSPTLSFSAALGITNDVAHNASHHLTSLQSLLGPLIKMGEENEKLKKDAELWRAEWAGCERERKRLELAFTGGNKDLLSPGPKFTAVLIDGESMVFHDQLLQQGFQGGQTAGTMLTSSLPFLLNIAVVSPNTPEVILANGVVTSVTGEVVDVPEGMNQKQAVMVQVFINKQGLGSALVKAGIVPSWSVYDAFWQGFSSVHGLFTVIDVGQSKDVLDAKINEHLKLYLSNKQCANIVLGLGSNDGPKTAATLEAAHDTDVVLLKGCTDLSENLRQLSATIASLPDLFSATPLPDKGAGAVPAPLSAEVASPWRVDGSPVARTKTPATSFSAVLAAGSPQGTKATLPKSGNLVSGSKPDANSTSTRRTGTASVSVSAGTESESGDSSSLETSPSSGRGLDTELEKSGDGLSRQGSVDVEVIEWNNEVPQTPSKSGPYSKVFGRPSTKQNMSGGIGKGNGGDGGERGGGGGGAQGNTDDEGWEEQRKKDRRGDKNHNGRKGKYADGDVNGVSVRSLRPRPCHTYYLSPWPCRSGDDCEYAHYYDLNESQLDELARLAKEIVCPYIKNNKCQFGDRDCVYGHKCPRAEQCSFGDTCRFRDVPNGHE